ncbi:MAG: Ppx/GppA family phosphatase [Caulobacterales bacterium]|nr:Ppx/GppA family phosphatase [Caulobacterales bacterium]
MPETPSQAPCGAAPDDARQDVPLYAALDLGTNNCRMLIARRAHNGFRIVEAYSRIVRLGEGLSHTGELSAAAMDRAVSALAVCADRIRRRRVQRVRAVATQACRAASNGGAFLERVQRETGLSLEVIEPAEEARLAVAGCTDLIDDRFRSALILDVGGGSTEISWVRPRVQSERRSADILAWHSVPIGVVTLAEHFPEPERPTSDWYESMVEAMRSQIAAFVGAEPHRQAFTNNQAQLIGTSGAVTSLASLHLGLAKYERARVDGLRMTAGQCRAVATTLMDLDRAGRAAHGCIGPDRADLVLAGAAILEAVQRHWPCEHLRVADRGLREGLLLSLMRRRRRRRR